MAMKIRKGDIVMVIAGDDKGKTGRVLAVDSEKQRVVVEKVNFVKRHTKARRQGAQGGIIEKEAPLHLSNVLLYDAKAGRGTRVGVRVLPDGRRVRVSRASGETLSKAD
jgi:large subunit ribosomal protein L24